MEHPNDTYNLLYYTHFVDRFDEFCSIGKNESKNKNKKVITTPILTYKPYR